MRGPSIRRAGTLCQDLFVRGFSAPGQCAQGWAPYASILGPHTGPSRAHAGEL